MSDETPPPAPTPANNRPELGGIAALGGIALAALVFLRLAAEIGEGETRAFDTGILLALRQPGDLAHPIGPAWLEAAMVDITALGGVTVLTLVTIGVIGFLLAGRRWSRAGFVFIAVVGSALLNTLLKLEYARPRPEMVAHLVNVTSTSFPSGHAMNSAAVYLTLGVLMARAVDQRRLKLYCVGIAALLALLIGASRVYLGVHYPTDVLAGWTVGAAWAALCWLVAERLRRRAGQRV